MISGNQTCAEFKSASPPMKDFPHLALLVDNNKKETKMELPMCQEQVDEICKESPQRVSLQYTAINTEDIRLESSPETIRAIEYQEEWGKDPEVWFANNNYEPVEYSTLDSEFFLNCYQGVDRFTAYGCRLDHSIHAWYMKQELEHSTTTFSSYLWVFDLCTRFCMACRCYYHKAQKHECVNDTRICSVCNKSFHRDVNLRRHTASDHSYAAHPIRWSGIEVEVMYNLRLLAYSARDISHEIPGRSVSEWEKAIRGNMYGCPCCQRVFATRRTFRSHATKVHAEKPALYRCYKCDEVHTLRGNVDVCLGKQRKLDLKDQEEINAFYEMQFMVLLQLDCPGSPRFWLKSDGSKMADEGPFEFCSALSIFLRNKIQDKTFVAGLRRLHLGGHKLERKMLDQMLTVAQCEEEFVSQGKGDRVIDVSSGNLDWYINLRSKARRGDERPRLSGINMGFVV